MTSRAFLFCRPVIVQNFAGFLPRLRSVGGSASGSRSRSGRVEHGGEDAIALRGEERARELRGAFKGGVTATLWKVAQNKSMPWVTLCVELQEAETCSPALCLSFFFCKNLSMTLAGTSPSRREFGNAVGGRKPRRIAWSNPPNPNPCWKRV